MSKTLTFEIPEELYEAFDHIARRDRKTTDRSLWNIWLDERRSGGPA